MFIKNTYNFKVKKFNLSIKCISEKHINRKYLSSIKKSKFILSKINNGELWQKKYINKINLSKSKIILGFFYNNQLIATSGLQNLNKKYVSVGIFIFDKNFLNKKVSHFFIAHACIFINKFFNKKNFFAGFNKKNIKSILSYEKIGFETYLTKKNTTFKRTTIQKIKLRLRKN
ncbi:hypothetical protein [Candidatus Pelagibacter sp. HIMB1483]|uniref:hypothetical protein n=1 Tax=Candidatus Pelagibacter sp. HIMB1483 TaxID=3415414 RepID=UPI003F87CB2A